MDWLNDPKLHSALTAAIVSLGVWFVKREVTRIDRALAQAVRRDELRQLREDMDRRHDENLARLDRIEESMESGNTGIHQRIDELFLKIPEWLNK